MLRRALLLCLALAPLPLAAQTAPTVRVRGTVERLDGATLVVRSREGAEVPVRLADGWTVSGVDNASLDAVKPGSFVGAAAVAGPNGALRALEVLVFPPGAKSNEGHYAWDLLPESTMTNATVAETVKGVEGPVLTLAYPGGEQRIEVPPETPVVTFAPAERADVKPGAPVFVPGRREADGGLTASRVIVGNRGVAPPM
jgi:hypothetical protein